MTALPPIAVIAGGLGTRLYPITKTIPKSLVQVKGAAFIDWQLKLFAKRGITKAVFCLGHLGEQIEAHIEKHGSQGIDVAFSHDGDLLRGTGGAIGAALPLLDETFFVTYGDSYLDIDYRAVNAAMERSSASALMTVYRNNDAWDRSNVAFDGGRILIYDKKKRSKDMQYIDYGLLLLTKDSLIPFRDKNTFDLSDFLSPLAETGKLAGFEVENRFYEVGSSKGILDLENYLGTEK